MYKLDNLDRKILYELDLNSRQNITKLAKKLRINRNTLNFRINRLIKERVIRNFVCLIRPSSLGLIPFKVYLQLQNLTKEDEKKLIEYVKTLPTHWSAKVNGGWDFIIGIMANDVREFNKIKMQISDKLSNYIGKRSISVTTEIIHFNRDYIIQKNYHDNTCYWISSNKKKEFSNKEFQILKLFSNNCRINVTEIASKTGLDVKTIISKIKYFEQQGIIYMYSISSNIERIGYGYFKALLTFKNFNEQNKQKIITYCKTRPNIINIVECIGDWDIELDFELQNVNDFYHEMRLLRNTFYGILAHTDTLLIEKEYGYTSIPENMN